MIYSMSTKHEKFICFSPITQSKRFSSLSVFQVMYQDVEKEGFLALLGITGVILLLALGLLIHLFAFHCYLSKYI